MRKNLLIPIILCCLLSVAVGCNSSTDDEEYQYVESSSVVVSGFYIQDNSKVLDSLSNVFFSIDLANAKIFNADSMPYGTKVNKLVPKITVASGASAVQLKYYSTAAQRDSTVNYLTNGSDTIDFSGGPVMLTVTSQSGAVNRTYEIKVNVHKVKSDSLAWYSMESAPLPTTFGTVKAQCTAQLAGTYYCLSSDGSEYASHMSGNALYALATTKDPSDPKWQVREVTMGFIPQVESLRSSDSALYILSDSGEMYTSTDCETWTSTGQTWHYIYGGYGDEILGSKTGADGNKICSYPSLAEQPMPADFPVEGTSVPATYTLSMGYAPQLVMVGGVKADGNLTDAAWSYDGTSWVMVSVKPLPIELSDVTMVPYRLVELPSSTWAPVNYPVLLAMGGRNDEGSINRTVYYSRDWGMTWSKAPSTVQLPAEMPTFYGASAFEYTSTMYPSRASHWTPQGLRPLHPAYSFIGLPTSRAIAPLESWECPAIYLIGGKNYSGETLNTMWRGVILEFTFEPVQ